MHPLCYHPCTHGAHFTKPDLCFRTMIMIQPTPRMQHIIVKVIAIPIPILQPNINIHMRYPPLPLAQQTPQPFNTNTSPLCLLRQRPLRLFQCSSSQCRSSCIQSFSIYRRCCVRPIRGNIVCYMSRLKPVTAEIEETLVCPLTGGCK